MFMGFKEIFAEQEKSLNYKIKTAIKAIKEGYASCNSKASIAFSGGKDSTVLWHLIKTHFPEQNEKTAIIFGNTGVEYPESLQFARQLGSEWGGDNFFEATPERLKQDGLKYEAQRQVLEHLIETETVHTVLKADGKLKTTQALEKACPSEMWKRFEHEKLIWKAGTIKSYWWCADQYGYPIMGKAASKLGARRINIDCFLKFGKTSSTNAEMHNYYEMLKKCKVSQMCCTVLKKEPSNKVAKDLKVDVEFIGLMASESHRRLLLFAQRGYCYEVKTKYNRNNMTVHHCNPLSIWTDDDIWEYIHKYNVPYAPLYDLEYKSEAGEICKMKRNGCIGCFTDYGRENSHMYVLRQTHPKKWKAVMNYGMAAEICKLKKFKTIQRQNILDVIEEPDQLAWAIENRPCAFD